MCIYMCVYMYVCMCMYILHYYYRVVIHSTLTSLFYCLAISFYLFDIMEFKSTDLPFCFHFCVIIHLVHSCPFSVQYFTLYAICYNLQNNNCIYCQDLSFGLFVVREDEATDLCNMHLNFIF